MDLSKFQLGVGPMSDSVVDLCLEYSAINYYNIMIIASRNQVDARSGYAFSTEQLVQKLRSNDHYDPNRVLICRDHCGPYFSDLDKSLSLEQAVDRCLETITQDCKSGFDLIHIDVSRVPVQMQYTVARKLFDHALSCKPGIMFEFGTEDNTGANLHESLEKLQQQLSFVQDYQPNVKFMVSQTGSLTRHTQVGEFAAASNKAIAQLIHDHGLLFKEHNADYLLAEQVALRKYTGVDAINIAPQLGSIQSQVMLNLGAYFPDVLDQFMQHVLNAGYWKKWVPEDITDDYTRVMASGHYCFGDPAGRSLISRLQDSHLAYDQILRSQLFNALDQYRIGYTL